MIVKNEEKNIGQALNWAKGYAFEQIVVDTGSTDRTVELAEQFGAKVHHFKWIDDFAAAKNFAMDLATGNWIAILDADEYIPAEDMDNLAKLLEIAQRSSDTDDEVDAISCPRWNLTGEGKVGSIIRTSRFFRNRSDLRYKGRIHEQVVTKGKRLDADNIKIMHTGYQETEIEESGKVKRNTRLLRVELAEDPNNLNIKAYLADSLWMDNDEKSQCEAEQLFTDVINGKDVAPVMKKVAYAFLINRYINNLNDLTKGEEMCRAAREEFPADTDFKFFHGAALNSRGEFRAALELLALCLESVDEVADYGGLSYLSANPVMLYSQTLRAAHNLGETEKVIEYATFALRKDKTVQEILGPYILSLLRAGKSYDEVLELLALVYDTKDLSDMMIIARAGKRVSEIDFAKYVLDTAGNHL